MQTLSNLSSEQNMNGAAFPDLFSKEIKVPKPYIHISGSSSQEKIEEIVYHPLKPNNLTKTLKLLTANNIETHAWKCSCI